ncbi:Stk1 family PASTA domain-containing Ser/Thr kinase, partial [Amycolatopsis rhizosphaerae]
PTPAPTSAPVPAPQASSVRPPWAVGDAERTVPAMSPVAPPQADMPTAFTAAAPMAGPRGTRAMVRPPQAPQPPQPPRTGQSPVPPQEPGPGLSGVKAKLTALLRDKRARWAAGGLAALVLLIVVLSSLSGGPKSSRTVTVPQVAGMDRATAAKTLSDNGFSAKFTQQRNNTVAAGLAVRSDPSAGTGALRGTEVTVVLSTGRPTVPDIGANTSLNQAETAIIAAELVPAHDESADQYSTTVAEGNVISVSPQPGTQLDLGSKVTIVVSKGRPPQPVPDVTGMSHDDAFTLLRQQGFEPYDAGADFSQNVPAGSVTRTTPAAGGQIQGSSLRVGVYVSNAVQVPSVLGRSIEEAMQILQQAGLQPDLKGRDRGFGLIIQQEPNAGELVKKGSKVNLRAIP